MMRCLREVNADAYTVGWYQTADLSSFSNETLLETQFNYQTNPLLSRKCVALVYDPVMTLQSGVLHIRAVRLSYAFCQLYAADPDVLKSTFDRSAIFEEIPIRVVCNPLSEAFLVGLEHSLPRSTESLDLASSLFFEKNLENLSLCLDELQNENGRVQHYQRQQQRQQTQMNSYLHKVRTENQARRLRQQPELEEDLTQFKKITQPSRLPALLWMHQIDLYCDQVDAFARDASLKLLLLAEVDKQRNEAK
jgi:translation initiation factor 3 subunit H